MQLEQLKQLAQQFLDDSVSPAEFYRALQSPPAWPDPVDESATPQLEHATLDLARRKRCGYPEVIFGEGKSVEAIREIAARLLAHGEPVLATRVAPEKATALQQDFPQSRYNPLARTLTVPAPQADSAEATFASPGSVTVVSAGTSDRPVAEEALETLAWMQVPAQFVYDVGVAGPQRLLRHVDVLQGSAAVVVVAGMEGALPSVVAGHVACPVIAVPTSIGYGANLGGFATLLAMLNSCAANVLVVNIDAGFRGGYAAGMIARNRVDKKE